VKMLSLHVGKITELEERFSFIIPSAF